MKVIKRNGAEVDFSPSKIQRVVEKANKSTEELSEAQVADVVNRVLTKCRK
jgi:transcriptional regulator NrdR family protein